MKMKTANSVSELSRHVFKGPFYWHELTLISPWMINLAIIKRGMKSIHKLQLWSRRSLGMDE